MHDGRFATLEEVLDHYNDPDLYSKPNVDVLLKSGSNLRNGNSLGLTEQEKADIITFLHMLTDTTHLNP
jgi:cytochrome c peroxidase